MSLPSFFSAIIIAWVFGYLLNNYTGLNMTGSLYEVDDYGRGSFLQIKNLILPAITLGIRPLSVIIQLCRSSLLEVLGEDYIRTAFAKGLNHYIVIFKHAFKKCIEPAYYYCFWLVRFYVSWCCFCRVYIWMEWNR